MPDFLWTGVQTESLLSRAFADLRCSFGLQRIHRHFDLEPSVHTERLYNRNNEVPLPEARTPYTLGK